MKTSYLKSVEKDQFTLLRELVTTSSFSGDKKGVDLVGQKIIEALAETVLAVEIDHQSKVGNNLIFRSPAVNNNTTNQILLVGHMDTVFPPDNPFNSYKEDDKKAYGPGVIDMKGGLVVAIFTLKALNYLGMLDTIPITFICNSDEETGSASSTGLISREAEKSMAGLVFECEGLNGEIVTGRRGKRGYLLKSRGHAGHAAFAGPKKCSAIHELAHKTLAFEALNNQQKQHVINVGVVQGGIGPNTVAEHAFAEIDTRYITLNDGMDIHINIEKISNKSFIDGTSSTLEITSQRPPMEITDQNRLLYQIFKEVGAKENYHFIEELRSGVSDANTIGSLNVPVIDGLGPAGDCDHSDKEYMIKDSLPAKCRITVGAIEKLWETQPF